MGYAHQHRTRNDKQNPTPADAAVQHAGGPSNAAIADEVKAHGVGPAEEPGVLGAMAPLLAAEDEEGIQAAEDEEGIQAAEDEEGVQAAEDEEGVQAAEDEEGVQAAEDEEGVQAAEDEEGVQAAEDEEGIQAAEDEEGVQAAEDEDGVQASEDEEGVQAAEDEEGVQAAQDEEGVQAAQDEEGVQAAQDEEGVQAAEDDDGVRAADFQPSADDSVAERSDKRQEALRGQPQDTAVALPEDIRAEMEAALGADLSDVEVKVGQRAESVAAKAYTAGETVHFAPDEYDPRSAEGKELLAHELSHVVQQQDGIAAGTQAMENEAEEAGNKIRSGRPT